MEIARKKEVTRQSTLKDWHESNLQQRLLEIFANNWKLAEVSLGVHRSEHDRELMIPDAYEIIIEKFGWIKFHELLTAFQQGRIEQADDNRKTKAFPQMTVGHLLGWIRKHAAPNRMIQPQSEFKGEESERIKRNQTLSDAEWLEENLETLWENITGAYGTMLSGPYLDGVVKEAEKRIPAISIKEVYARARMKWKTELQNRYSLSDQFFSGRTPKEIESKIRMRHPTDVIPPITLQVKIEIIREYKKIKDND